MQLGACSQVLDFWCTWCLALGSEYCFLLSVEFQKSSRLISLCPADELCTSGSLVLYTLRHLRAQFSWLINSKSCLDWVCGIVVMPGNFLEQDSVCHTGGMAVIHHVTRRWAAKGTGSFALAVGRLAVIWASHLEGGQFSEAIQGVLAAVNDLGICSWRDKQWHFGTIYSSFLCSN